MQKIKLSLCVCICSLSALFSFGYGQNCTLTIDLPMDTVLCSPGNLNLPAQINGNFISLAWSPALGLNDSTQLQATANISQDVAYTLTVKSTGANNLIFNGDFQQGDTGFTSDYTLGNSMSSIGILADEGQYAITDDPSDTHSQFDNCNDHTGGSGNMMVVNASGETNDVWCQQITVSSNAEYDFSAWVTSVTSQNPARLQFSINGDLLGDEFVASSNTCNWQNFSAQWESDNVTAAEICIVNVNLTPAGNDFALDDIVFREICNTSATIFIDLAELVADFTLPNSFCQAGGSIELSDFLDANSDTDGEWRVDNQALAGSLLDPSSLSTGSHFLQYEVSAGDCSETASGGFNIDEFYFAGDVPADPLVFCQNGPSIDLDDFLMNETFGADWFQIGGPDAGVAFDQGLATVDISALSPDNYQFAYITSFNGACPGDSAVVDIILSAGPVAIAGEDQSLDCIASEASIGDENADPNLMYSWTLDGNPIPGATQTALTVTDPGLYVLEVNAGSCSSFDSVLVSENMANITAILEVTHISCGNQNNGSIQVIDVEGGMEPYMYSLNGASFQTNPEFNNIIAGNHIITVQDAAGCEQQFMTILEEASDISVLIQALGSTSLRAGDSLQLELQILGDTATIIRWSANANCDGCTSLTVRPTQSTTYNVTVTNAAGCTAFAEINILVEETGIYFMPNAFSPNGDGVNDAFYVQAGPLVEEVVQFQVFDRWGGILFSQDSHAPNDASFGWEGRKNDQRLMPGVYIYMIELRLIDGNSQVFSGEINLLR